MKGFKRGEKGFTLVELLIVVAILGILAAVVIPNVVGLLGRGGKQAYSTDLKTIQLGAAAFYADVQDGHNVTPLWGDTNGNVTDPTPTVAGHYYPTAIAAVNLHTLTQANIAYDRTQMSNQLIVGSNGTGGKATDADIQASAIWMGLLINKDSNASPNSSSGVTGGDTAANRYFVTPLLGKNSLYLNEEPKSALFAFNGDPGTGKSGGYAWVVGKNGVVFGAYRVYGQYPVGSDGTTDVTGYGTAGPTDDFWYAGFSGAYP